MSSLLTPLLYSLLPAQATNILLPYFTSNLPGLFPKTQPRRNYQIVYTLLVGGYLLYTLVSDYALLGFGKAGSGEGGEEVEDWYALLGVSRSVEEDGLKKAYRLLSRTHHPDRRSSTSSDTDSNQTFILIRKAYETLTNPTHRYAYDRFGPDIVDWFPDSSPSSSSSSYGSGGSGSGSGSGKGEVGLGEYMKVGLMRSGGFYLVSGGIMGLLALTGKARDGAYWRTTLLIILLFLELSLILSPSPTSPSPSSSSFLSIHSITNLPNPLPSIPQFLQIRLLHRLFTTASIAVSQLSGVWADSGGKEEGWEVVERMVKGIELECIAGFQQEITPLLTSGDGLTMEKLVQDEMIQVLVDRTIATHPHIRQTYSSAISSSKPHHHYRPTPNSIRNQRSIYPTPSPEPEPAPQTLASLEVLEKARNIPLPPSPPPSPLLGTMELT